MPADEDLVAYLTTQVGLTAGTNLFVGPMPETPDACVAVTHYGSQRSDSYVMGASLTAPGYEVENVQVMVRDTQERRANARTTANSVHALLANLQSTELSGRTYFAVEDDGTPYCIGKDQNERWRFVANYVVKKDRG